MGIEIEIDELDQGKYYTVSFDNRDYRFSPEKLTIVEIKVLYQLKKSVKLLLIAQGIEKWYSADLKILLFDEIPASYFRKEKLKEIEKKTQEHE